MCGLRLGLVAVEEIALAGGVVVFGSGGNKASFFDLVDANTVSYL